MKKRNSKKIRKKEKKRKKEQSLNEVKDRKIENKRMEIKFHTDQNSSLMNSAREKLKLKLLVELSKEYGIPELSKPDIAKVFMQATEDACQKVSEELQPIDDTIEQLYAQRRQIDDEIKNIYIDIQKQVEGIKSIEGSGDIDALKRALDMIEKLKSQH